MEIRKQCKTCGKEFTAIKTTQLFCCRKCFRKDYNDRKREEFLNRQMKHPAYSCQECGRRCLLDFDPSKNTKMFDKFECPYCGYSPRKGWESRNSAKGRSVRVIAAFGAYSSTSLFRTITTVEFELT